MSILIEDMEMPKSCDECPLLTEDGDYNVCFVGKRRVMWEWKHDRGSEVIYPKPDWCPLVPVPPHGRLIDADAFFKDVCNSIENMTKLGVGVDADFLWAKLNDALDNAPTVIPADKDGET